MPQKTKATKAKKAKTPAVGKAVKKPNGAAVMADKAEGAVDLN